MRADGSPPPLLSIRDLRLEFDTFDGVYRAIDGVSFDLAAGESLGIVGETGCGKSVTAKSILGLVPSPPARVVSGRILYGGEDLLAAGEVRLRDLRGVEIAMIFQDPMTYLNPVFTVGRQLVDVIMAHQRRRPEGGRLSRRQARAHAVELLRRVHLPNPERQMDACPHQLSGGMRQRVLIAQALSGNPRLLIADEPTTALDVTIQAQILDLIAELMEDLDLSVIMISHDLGVVATLCRRVIVMYAGQVVEDAATSRLFSSPGHPYTRGLLRAVPHPGRRAAALAGIPGALPNLYEPPPGCRFQHRCAHAMPACEGGAPLRERAPGQRVACLLHGEGDGAAPHLPGVLESREAPAAPRTLEASEGGGAAARTAGNTPRAFIDSPETITAGSPGSSGAPPDAPARGGSEQAGKARTAGAGREAPETEGSGGRRRPESDPGQDGPSPGPEGGRRDGAGEPSGKARTRTRTRTRTRKTGNAGAP